MNGQVIEFGVVFLVLFVLGGIIGIMSLPEFAGRFYIAGIVFAIFGTGAGFLFLNINHR